MSAQELAITVVLFGNAFFFLGFIPWVGNRSLDAWLRASDASWRASPERRLRELEQSLRGYSIIRPASPWRLEHLYFSGACARTYAHRSLPGWLRLA